MYLVRCPKCGHEMKVNPTGNDISKKSKRCVYCGKTFVLRGRIIKQL